MPPPPGNKALIAGLIKGNQWVFIVPKNKALGSHDRRDCRVSFEKDISSLKGNSGIRLMESHGFLRREDGKRTVINTKEIS